MAELNEVQKTRLNDAGWDVTYDHGNIMLFRETDRVSAHILDISLRTGGKENYFVVNAYQRGDMLVGYKTVFSVTEAVVFVLNHLAVGFTPRQMVR